jgi:hypothetical protein
VWGPFLVLIADLAPESTDDTPYYYSSDGFFLFSKISLHRNITKVIYAVNTLTRYLNNDKYAWQESLY